ncbi:hypothetical protein RHSIM_Rhsim10G0147500 [Rhododendron simsii]|uniref:Holocarboxylase synthetase n=1 Tax=Rhododendron simsii TaxID=118357 RepID=A0A834GDS3_RHOSS|nr:hypothetical protein RHSIM_Rhsim10G0147500 [Rhododendron simsii]
MAKKRKSDATRLEEVDRTMYTSFCSAANSLSQLYTQSMNQQRLSFQAGERHGLEKLYEWILRQQESGTRVNTIDVVTYLQNELEYGLEEHQHPQTAMHLANTSFPVSSTSFGPTTAAQGPRSAHFDHHQPKTSVFSNALSSPVRRSLQQCHLPQGNYFANNVMQSGNGARNNETLSPNNLIRDSNDLSMDMHSDSPGRESS